MDNILFYCTPQRKEREGLADTIHVTYEMTDKEATNLRNAYNDRELAYQIFFSVLAAVCGAGITETVVNLGFGIPAAGAVSIADRFLTDLGDQLDDVVTADGDIQVVDLKYRYVRKGSQDGYYKLGSVKII